MKIRSIEAIPIKYTEPNDFNNTRHTLVVKVMTEDGIIGWGEAVAMWPEAIIGVKAIIERGFAPLLIGEDALNTEANWTKMKKHTWWYGEGGLASFAISGVDMALWDIKGKALGVPLYQLFGGPIWDRLPACASTHPSKPSNQANAEEIAQYILQDGYQSIKIGFGKKGHAGLGKNHQHDIDFVKTVRHAIGDAGFMVDIGNAVEWDIPTAIRMTQEFEKYNITWIEEPLHPNNMRGYAELRAQSKTLIAAGEREFTVHGYYRLVQSGLIDVIGIDPARAEGITGFLKIRDMIGREGRKFNAHCWSTAITSAASLHLSISSPHCMVLEFKPIPNPMQHEIVAEPIEHKAGWIGALDKPGLGIEILEEVLLSYRME